MPQLTIRGITPLQAKQISKPLIVELAEIMDTDKDNFTFDLICTQSFYLSNEVDTYPFVQIGWFDRGQIVKDKVAQSVSKCFKNAGIQEVEMVFIPFEKTSYYTNEEHY